jgi:anaerobic magnesium-protoporphyrin IX monomethyl ester cyclase
VNPLVHLVSIAAPFRNGVEDMTRPPSALLYVGGHLRRHGFDVRVHHVRERDMPATTREILEGPPPLFVGFSMMTGMPIAASAKASAAIKAARPDIPIVWGGIHPSLMPRECLTLPWVDYVVMGEGEEAALELAQFLSRGCPADPHRILGIGFKEGTQPMLTPPRPFAHDLDEFRQDWSLVDPRRYLRPEGSIHFITSRGCPHDCGFCYNLDFNRRRWRGHSVEFAVEAVTSLCRASGARSVVFDDDNFLVNRRRGLEILRRLKQCGINCNWLELRCDYITDELIGELADLGVRCVFVGWESGSDATLQRISKGFNRDLILERMAILGEHRRLTIDASAIIGFPWETPEDVEQTVDTALAIFRMAPFRVQFNLGIYVPYPGTPILQEALDRGFSFPIDPEGWRKFDILSGEMRVPWLDAQTTRRYNLLDRYAKRLRVYGTWLRVHRIATALVAYGRLRLRFFAFPFEVEGFRRSGS